MKAYDIIQQLYAVLPSQTGLFSDDVSLSTLSKVSSTVTAVSASAHGLTTGDYVYITGAKWKTAITSITRVADVATVVCSAEHDLTEVWDETVEIIGANEANFNGTFTLLTVPDRYTFTFTISDSGATTATGTMFLLEARRFGFNGWYSVTVTNSTTFTYTSQSTTSATAYGTLIARKMPRVTGAVSLERAEAAYTKFGANKYWCFVVLGPVTASKSRYTQTDAINTSTAATAFRQHLLNEINVYVFVPTSASLSVRAERDAMTDVSKYLFKSLLGKVYSTYFVDSPVTTMHFVQHRPYLYKGSYYVHEFSFEAISEITTNDITENEITRAFRDLTMNVKSGDMFGGNDFETTILSTLVNLDEEL